MKDIYDLSNEFVLFYIHEMAGWQTSESSQDINHPLVKTLVWFRAWDITHLFVDDTHPREIGHILVGLHLSEDIQIMCLGPCAE